MTEIILRGGGGVTRKGCTGNGGGGGLFKEKTENPKWLEGICMIRKNIMGKTREVSGGGGKKG